MYFHQPQEKTAQIESKIGMAEIIAVRTKQKQNETLSLRVITLRKFGEQSRLWKFVLC